MNLAKSIARLLIGEELRYPSGKPVACVIADICTGGVADAAACAPLPAAIKRISALVPISVRSTDVEPQSIKPIKL